MLPRNRFCLILAIAGFVFASCRAQGAEINESQVGVTKELAINRSMTEKFRQESLGLKEESLRSPAPLKEFADLQRKIQGLQEDKDRLLALLPESARAAEFLKDMIARRQAPPSPMPSVKPKRELSEASMNQLNALHETALTYASQKKWAEAAATYEEIIMIDPDDDEAYLLMGHSYLLAGSYPKAEEAFHNAVHIDPKNIDEIVPFYEKLTTQALGDDMALSNLGYAYLILGEFAKAKTAFSDALNVNPENDAALQGMDIVENQ